jgi:hypothetical protein
MIQYDCLLKKLLLILELSRSSKAIQRGKETKEELARFSSPSPNKPRVVWRSSHRAVIGRSSNARAWPEFSDFLGTYSAYVKNRSSIELWKLSIRYRFAIILKTRFCVFEEKNLICTWKNADCGIEWKFRKNEEYFLFVQDDNEKVSSCTFSLLVK